MLQVQLSELKSSNTAAKEAFCSNLTFICAWCGKKRINGNQRDHVCDSPISAISHGICPECAENLMDITKEVDCPWCGKKYIVNKNNFANNCSSKNAALNHGVCPECITDIIGGINEIDEYKCIAI